MPTIDPTSGLASSPTQTPSRLVPQGDFERSATTLKLGDGRARTVSSRLTRKGMEQAIAAGRSVLYDGMVLTSVSQLPSEASLAVTGGSVADAQAVRQKNEETIARLQAENKSLKDAQAKATSDLTPAVDVAPGAKK